LVVFPLFQEQRRVVLDEIGPFLVEAAQAGSVIEPQLKNIDRGSRAGVQ
jgi:hypothetical protein